MCRVRIVKNELGGSATQQELRAWEGGGSEWNEQGNWGLNPQTPVNLNPDYVTMFLFMIPVFNAGNFGLGSHNYIPLHELLK